MGPSSQTDQFYLVNIRDELPFPGHVDLLVVGPQLALDGEEQHFQVPFLREPCLLYTSDAADDANVV